MLGVPKKVGAPGAGPNGASIPAWGHFVSFLVLRRKVAAGLQSPENSNI